MGNKLSCSCAPLIRKAYRYEDSPWQATRRRDGHLLRLWAEVFHVSAQGNVKWQQVSEDLVPVNITCIQDTPECVFHITAYNSQVDKILDVRLVQPGTRLGQASECFVYWKDPATGDTWGLNFTSPIDAKQFRECCSPSFKFSRKASSSYSLKLEPPKNKMKGKRKPVSTPSSPSRLQREPQCTCMTRENLHNLQRMRNEASRGRITGAATLPRTQQGRLDDGTLEGISTATRRERMFTAPSSASVYDNVGNSLRRGVGTVQGNVSTSIGQTSGDGIGGVGTNAGGVKQTRSEGSLKSFPSTPDDAGQRSGAAAAGGGGGGGGGIGSGMANSDSMTNTNMMDRRETRSRAALRKEAAKSIDYSEMESIREAPIQKLGMDGGQMGHRRTKSKSSDDVFEQVLLAAGGGRSNQRGGSGGVGNSNRSLAGLLGLGAQSSGDMSTLSLDSNALKRMLQPMTSTESAGDESPSERAMSYHGGMQVHPFGHGRSGHGQHGSSRSRKAFSRMTSSRSSSIQDYDRKSNYTHSDSFRSSIDQQSIYTLDQEDDDDRSPPSDNVLFDNQCYATTPSSSNGEGGYGDSHLHSHNQSRRRRGGDEYDDDADYEGESQQQQQQHQQQQLRRGRGGRGRRRGHLPVTGLPNSPTSRLLMEYETHLRNTLARGLDAESYSLHTFEALLTQSMENLESIVSSGVHAIDHDHDRNQGNGHRRSPPTADRIEAKKGFLREIKRIHRRFQSLPPLSGSPPMGKSSTLPLTHSKSAGMHFSAASLAAAAAAHHRGDYGGSGLHSMHRGNEHSFVQQASLESADSRLCYLTSSEISDDERMSLTTAISDEDDVESTHNSPYKSRISVVAESTFNCTGAVRKAGFLSVKKWLLRKKHQVELARKRGWKGYWVCLKGTTLLFYPCDNPREGRSIENTPKHLIIVDGAIMQPIPEHPKREYIFCLSTAFGDAYLFQAPCQVELENWVNGIHSACAAAFARHRGKTGTLHLLQEEIYRLEKEIESDSKMRHMADLQLTVVSDVESRQTLLNQIGQWEENLERLQCEQFRIRCYMASLQNTELPNPKNLLAHVSRGTKNTLNRLGVFTVSSFHAYVSACSPSLLNNLLAGRGATKRRQSAILSRSNSASSRRSLNLSTGGTQDLPSLTEKPLKVILPDSRSATIYVREGMSAEELLALSCGKRQLIPTDHFLRLFRSKDDPDDYFVPHRTDLVENLTYVGVEVCAKILYQVELSRSTPDQMWGFSVEAELVETNERNDELCVTVSRVEDKSLAMQQGIIKGDEIMVINGAIVSDLDMMYIESVLQEELSLCAMMRSCRTEPPEFTGAMKTTDDYIEQLVCPPPPSDPPALSDEMISGLIVPAPAWNQERLLDRKMRSMSSKMSSTEQDIPNTSSEQIETLLKSAEHVTSEYCRSPLPSEQQRRTSSPPPPSSVNFGRHMTDAEKLRKVVLELVETERTYVKHLNNLLEYYLEPLKKETFLSNAEINALFGNIQEIVAFQRVFQQSLEEAVHQAEPDFHRFDSIYQFKNVLFSLGGSFRYYANHFKLYSSFCASHSKAQKVLHPNEGNQSLQNFLQARNPKQQHSSTLESYLIKPIQRILKYPLLLQQLKNLTDPDSDEHLHLAEALKGMEKVAEHINEMQRIHEEYGAIFDHLFRQHTRVCKQWGPVLGQHVDLSPGELLYYGGVEWLNISDFLGKIKKGLELHAMCFVFKTAVVFLCKERIRQKKKLMGGSSKANAPEVEIIRYQVLIPVTEVQVRASSIRDVDSHFMWELIHLRSHVHRRSEKTYHLSNSTGEFRNAFLKTIRQIIRESVRNMSIPANKPSTGGSDRSKNDRYATPTAVTSSSSSSAAAGAAATAATAGLRSSRGASAATSAVDSMTRTLSNKKKSLKVPQRHSAGNIVNGVSSETYDNADDVLMRGSRETTMSEDDDGDDLDVDATTMTDTRENSEDSGGGGGGGIVGIIGGGGGGGGGVGGRGVHQQRDFKRHGKPMLGRTPNHLSLSTTSTLSTGSTGSTAAKLIQASNTPSNYQPPSKDPPAGSPVWKPRDGPTSQQTFSSSDKSPLLTVGGGGGDSHRPVSAFNPSENNSINANNNRSLSSQPQQQQQQYFVYDDYNHGGSGGGGGVNANRTSPSANKDRYVPGKRVDC